MKIKKFFFNSKGLEDFYIKNGYLVIKNVLEKKYLDNLSKYILSEIKLTKKSFLRRKRSIDYHDISNLIMDKFENSVKYDELILEQYIGGQEIQVAVINGKPLGAIELIPKRLFYDYKAKYTKTAKTKHVMPARISKKKYNEVLMIAKKTHRVLGCRGVTRSDFKFYNNNFYLLEINTQPGMTGLSLVPEIANFKGINFENLVEKILLDASINR